MMAMMVYSFLLVSLRRIHTDHEISASLITFRGNMLRVTWMRYRRVTCQ